MFAYTVEAALQAHGLDRIVISSDDPDLAAMAGRYGIGFVQRPADLAVDTTPLDDAVRHVCRLLQERDGYQPDVILTMQGNVPVRKAGQIDEVIARLARLTEASAVCTAQPLRFRPEWAKIITDGETGACAPYMPADTRFRMQEYAPLYVMDGAIYGVRWNTLWQTAGSRATHAWFGERPHLLVQDDARYSLEVDYADQAALAEHHLRALAGRSEEEPDPA